MRDEKLAENRKLGKSCILGSSNAGKFQGIRKNVEIVRKFTNIHSRIASSADSAEAERPMKAINGLPRAAFGPY